MGKPICDLSHAELEEVFCQCDTERRKLEEELKIARSDIQDLKELIIKLNFDKFGFGQ